MSWRVSPRQVRWEEPISASLVISGALFLSDTQNVESVGQILNRLDGLYSQTGSLEFRVLNNESAIDELNSFTASVVSDYVTKFILNNYTSSVDVNFTDIENDISTLNSFTESIDIRYVSRSVFLEFSQSVNSSLADINGELTDLNTFSASLNDIYLTSSSFTTVSASLSERISNDVADLITLSGSFVLMSASIATNIDDIESDILNLQQFSSSLGDIFVTDNEFISLSGSLSDRILDNLSDITNLRQDSASFSSRISDNDVSITQLQSFSASIDTIYSTDIDLLQLSESLSLTDDTLNSAIQTLSNKTISINGTSNQVVVSNEPSQSINDSPTYTIGLSDDVVIQRDLVVLGNFEVRGALTEVNISSSIVNINDNIITLNAFSPYKRYAGIEVIDSGSSATSASIVWDSLNDYWLFKNSNGSSGKVVTITTGSYGSELSISNNFIVKATSPNTIGNSLLVDSGQDLIYNIDKFRVNGGSGDVFVTGLLNLSTSSVDSGSVSSKITFVNSDNEIGYVDSTDTLSEINQLIGYRASDGMIVASSIIDGGSF